MTEPEDRANEAERTAQARVRLRQIFVSFAKIGAVLFGGGYAMLPLLEREVVDRRRWCTHAEMGELYALAQVVPGVIAVNTAMLVGHRHRGTAGAVAVIARRRVELLDHGEEIGEEFGMLYGCLGLPRYDTASEWSAL